MPPLDPRNVEGTCTHRDQKHLLELRRQSFNHIMKGYLTILNFRLKAKIFLLASLNFELGFDDINLYSLLLTNKKELCSGSHNQATIPDTFW